MSVLRPRTYCWRAMNRNLLSVLSVLAAIVAGVAPLAFGRPRGADGPRRRSGVEVAIATVRDPVRDASATAQAPVRDASATGTVSSTTSAERVGSCRVEREVPGVWEHLEEGDMTRPEYLAELVRWIEEVDCAPADSAAREALRALSFEPRGRLLIAERVSDTARERMRHGGASAVCAAAWERSPVLLEWTAIESCPLEAG